MLNSVSARAVVLEPLVDPQLQSSSDRPAVAGPHLRVQLLELPTEHHVDVIVGGLGLALQLHCLRVRSASHAVRGQLDELASRHRGQGLVLAPRF